MPIYQDKFFIKRQNISNFSLLAILPDLADMKMHFWNAQGSNHLWLLTLCDISINVIPGKADLADLAKLIIMKMSFIPYTLP